MKSGKLHPAEKDLLEELASPGKKPTPGDASTKLWRALSDVDKQEANAGVRLELMQEGQLIEELMGSDGKFHLLITDTGREALRLSNLTTAAPELAEVLPAGAGDLAPALEQLMMRNLKGTMSPQGRQLILSKLDEALGEAPSGARWSEVLGREQLELSDRLALRNQLATRTDLRWDARYITAEPVDPQKVWDMARERTRWAAQLQDPVVAVRVEVQGQQETFEVLLRGTDRTMAAMEQRIPGVSLRAETLDHTVKLTAEEWEQAQTQLYSYGARQDAAAARPDIIGEAKAAREARRAELGPMPTNLKTSKAYTEAFLERWGDRGIENPPLVADFSYMTTEIAREVTSQLDLMMRTFPKTADSVWATGSAATMKKVPSMPLQLVKTQKPNVMADASSVGTLRWNPKFHGKGGDWVKRGMGADQPAIHEVRSNGFRFHVYLGDDPAEVVSEARSTVSHEFGHLMDYQAMRNTTGAAKQRGAEYQARLSAILRAHEDAISKQLGRSVETSEMVSLELSEYGAERIWDGMELVAESVCEAMCSPNPRPLAREIFELVREYAEGIPASS